MALWPRLDYHISSSWVAHRLSILYYNNKSLFKEVALSPRRTTTPSPPPPVVIAYNQEYAKLTYRWVYLTPKSFSAMAVNFLTFRRLSSGDQVLTSDTASQHMWERATLVRWRFTAQRVLPRKSDKGTRRTECKLAHLQRGEQSSFLSFLSMAMPADLRSGEAQRE